MAAFVPSRRDPEVNEAALSVYRRLGFSERSKSPDGQGRDLFLGVRLDAVT